jgi:hypothetical protein
MRILYVGNLNHVVAELNKNGHQVTHLEPTNDFAADLANLHQQLQNLQVVFRHPDVVIGNHRGASLVMEASPPQPIILLAPTYKKDGIGLKKPAVVIHGVMDTVVPFEDSMKLERVCIHMVQDDDKFGFPAGHGSGVTRLISILRKNDINP